MGWKTVLAGEPTVDVANSNFHWDGSAWSKTTISSNTAVANSGSGIAAVPFTTIIDNGLTAGAGITSTAGGTIDLKVDDTTVEVATDTLQIKNEGVANAQVSTTADIAVTKLADNASGNNALVDTAGTISWETQGTAFNKAFGTGSGTIPDAATVTLKDGTVAFTGTIAGITPTTSTHLTTKAYVDSLITGLSWKDAAKASSTADITLTNPGTDTFDGIVLTSQDRILVQNQTATEENGLYYFDTSSTAMGRVLDMDAWDEIPGAAVFVQEGTANADKGFVCTADEGGTLDVTAITWAEFAGGTGITDGAGLEFAGSVLNVGSNNTGAITVNANDIACSVDDTTIGISGTTPGVLYVKALGVDEGELAAGAVVNSKVDAAAAINFSKMEGLTTDRALVSGSGGVVEVSLVTSTEIGYLTGLSENISTSLSGKLAVPSLTGDEAVVTNGAGTAFATVSGFTTTEMGYLASISSDVQTQLGNKIETSTEGAANGVATLDANTLLVEKVVLIQTGTTGARPTDVAGANYGMIYVNTTTDELQIQLNPVP